MGSTDSKAQEQDWYLDHETFAAVAAWAKQDGSLDQGEVWDFIDEPWHYDELHRGWRVWLAAENAIDNRAQARMEESWA